MLSHEASHDRALVAATLCCSPCSITSQTFLWMHLARGLSSRMSLRCIAPHWLCIAWCSKEEAQHSHLNQASKKKALQTEGPSTTICIQDQEYYL
jgi:hypothetical protein